MLRRQRRRTLVLALLLAIAATASGLWMVGLPARLDWAAMERTGWVAGIIGALFSALSTAAAFPALPELSHPGNLGGPVGGVRQAATAGLTYQMETPHGSVAHVLDVAGVLSTLAPKRRVA